MELSSFYLYAGLVVGWLVGRWRPSRSPWVGRATLGAVVVLLGLLGASFRSIASAGLTATLPAAFLFVGVLMVATAGVYLALRRWVPDGSVKAPPTAPPPPPRVPTSVFLVTALLAGYGLGKEVLLPTGILIPLALAVLLALVGYGMETSFESIRRAWVPIVSAAVGAVLAGLVVVVLVRIPSTAAFGTALGFGWYSLTGPLVAARLGATLGLLAFLVNFLREALTMVLAPYIGPRLRGEGLAALGGATALDTTLYFVVRYGDRRAGALAVASGLTLTIAASLIVPLVLAV